MPTYNEIIQRARADGNLGLIDNVCRTQVERGRADATTWQLLAEVAAEIGDADRAERYARKSERLGGTDAQPQAMPAAKQNEVNDRKRGRHKYLLIREWGQGFWSDITQVLGGLLIAEASGRRPVIHWGGRSRYTDDPTRDAFSSFFKPIGNETIVDLEKMDGRYPEGWRSLPLDALPPAYLKKSMPPPYGPSLLHRDEDVVVSDFATSVVELLPWIENLHTPTPQDISRTYARLFARYLRPQPEIEEMAAKTWRELGAPEGAIAVHVRLSDKGSEGHPVRMLLSSYHQEIDTLSAKIGDVPIFLMTDSRQTLDSFRRRYGARLLHANATRTDLAVGLHFQPHPSRYELGREVLVDVLLAAKCDYFIGTGWSNVSRSISLIKKWPADRYRLLGENKMFRRPMSLYDHHWRLALTGGAPKPVIKQRCDEKPTAGLLHNMARSGGTLVGRCLGSMEGITLFSEIHPLAAVGTFDPATQAREWHGLFTATETADLDADESLTFEDLFVEIVGRVDEREGRLVIRDWSHIDYIGPPARERPTNRPVIVERLTGRMTLNRAAIVRHPIDQWLSLLHVQGVKQRVTLERYLEGCWRFAKMIRGLPTVRYEDFTASPAERLAELCDALGVPFDSSYDEKWMSYRKITTSTRGARLGETIEPRPRRKVPPELLDRFAHNVHYQNTLSLLGYAHP